MKTTEQKLLQEMREQIGNLKNRIDDLDNRFRIQNELNFQRSQKTHVDICPIHPINKGHTHDIQEHYDHCESDLSMRNDPGCMRNRRKRE